MNQRPDTQSGGLTIRGVEVQAVTVPLTFPLGTSAAIVREAPLLLADVQTEEGIVGRSYLFCYTPSGAQAIAAHLREAVELAKGQSAAPRPIFRDLTRRFALLGLTGTVRMALAALDVALWDALAISRQLPLASLLGATPRPVRAYNSSGLGLMSPDAAADEAEALPRGRALQEEDVYWLEEPTRHGDLRGNAAIARELRLPLQIGENFNGPEAMLEALEADACDFVMPDLPRIGGVTGWMEAAGIAAARGIEMSSHLLPEVSAHLLAATPTCQWLEYVDWADAVLEQPLEVFGGEAVVPDRPGHGMVWDVGKVAVLPTI